MLQIPPDQLAADVLRALVEEYVTRDGTDYGTLEVALERKVEQVLGQVTRGEVVVLFDAETSQCNLATAAEWKKHGESFDSIYDLDD